MNELDEMRDAWREQGRRLAWLEALGERTLTEVESTRTRAGLRRWRWLPAYELAAGIVAMLWLVHFAEGVLGAPLLLGSTAALFAAALLGTIAAGWQLALGTVDPAGPVAEVQERLERARALRLRVTRWTILVSPLLWTPLALVFGQALFGLHLEKAVGWPWIIANLVVGYAFIPLGLWALARASRRWGQSRVWQRLRDDIAGRSLARALRSVEEVAAFRQEA
jgi:hypothetical protein